MLTWRITRAVHTALDGEGGRRVGGRWNSPGVAVVFTSTHLSLAALEYLVHVDIDEAPDDLVALAVEIPDDAAELRLTPSDLPTNWQEMLYSAECRGIGDSWARDRQSLLLRVPSVIVPEEENVLINPAHAGAEAVRVVSERSFSYDPRLFQN